LIIYGRSFAFGIFLKRASTIRTFARQIGVTSFPTLFLEINGKHYDLKGSAITLNDLEENLNIIKEKGGILNDGYNTPVACNWSYVKISDKLN